MSSFDPLYGAPRVHAELRLGMGIRSGASESRGCCGCWPWPGSATARSVTDITEHPTATGKVYCCAVLDVFSRTVVGWSIADHMRSDLVVDGLQMATWRRRPQGTIVHSDCGSQYTSWVLGHGLRDAGLLGSMGRVASYRWTTR